LDDFKRALRYSFLLLRYRDRATQEISDRLRKKNYAQATIDKVTKYLIENAYLNDVEFAKKFVAYRLSRGFGEKRIVFDLGKFGISSEQGRLEFSAFNKDKYKAIIIELANKKIKRYKKTDDKRLKLFRYLIQRGFSYEEITKVLKKIKI